MLDVNSLYPWAMYYCKMPYGEGLHFEGEYVQDDVYNLYTISFTCQFELKVGYLPTIQLKHNRIGFRDNEYVTSSHDEYIRLNLTSVDYELFMEHYDVYNVEYHGGWKFMSTDSMFKPYIDKWMKIKIESTQNGNAGMRTLAKLMLNALYGKFALSPNVQSKIPVMKDGVIHYTLGERETRKSLYIPVGTFITAYARHKTITSAQRVFDRFLYADTDSLHLLGTEIPEGLDVDPVQLGAWKHESTFTRARFVRQKTYIEEIDGEFHITCAGMPSRCYSQVTWDNFKEGNSFDGKLMPKHTKGGIVLVDTQFTIK